MEDRGDGVKREQPMFGGGCSWFMGNLKQGRSGLSGGVMRVMRLSRGEGSGSGREQDYVSCG